MAFIIVFALFFLAFRSLRNGAAANPFDTAPDAVVTVQVGAEEAIGALMQKTVRKKWRWVGKRYRKVRKKAKVRKEGRKRMKLHRKRQL